MEQHKQQDRRFAWLPFALAIVVVLASVAVFVHRPWALPAESSAAEPAGPAEAPTPGDGRSVSILGAGDVLMHPELWAQARRDGGGSMEFGPIFAHAAPAISAADLALCHLETPIAPPGGPFEGFPTFSVPQEVIGGIKSAGFDGCSTASNHAIDHGPDGVVRTLDALDLAGLGHTGTYRNPVEAAASKIYEVKGVRVAHLSYTKHFNGLQRPAGMEWIANQIDPTKIAKDAKAARTAGAEIVVVSMHWGTEYEHEPDVDQQTWARAVAAAPDVDVVFGHHAHVVQSVEQVNGKWIIYGMGNQVARHAEPINANREGVMMRLTFVPAANRRWSVGTIEALPVFVDLNPNIRLIDLRRALAGSDLSAGRRAIYTAAVDRIRGHLLTRGADAGGLVVLGAAP